MSSSKPADEAEWKTRKLRIDPRLDAAGWPRRAGPLSAKAFCTEEEETESGPADYALWLENQVIGVVEAKKLTVGPQNVLTQAARYARGLVSQYTDSTDTTWYYQYDEEMRLTSIANGSGVQETIAYGPLGGIATRSFPATSSSGPFLGVNGTQYRIAEDLVVGVTASSTTASVNVLLGAGRIATVSNSSVLYYHRDRLGSVIGTSLNGGASGAKYRYDPYGLLNATSNVNAANASELGYTGALTLSGGLVYLNARVYSPAMRRFLQADNVDNKRYTYANGDPINHVDPSGHATEDEGSSHSWAWDRASWYDFLAYGDARAAGITGGSDATGTQLSSYGDMMDAATWYGQQTYFANASNGYWQALPRIGTATQAPYIIGADGPSPTMVYPDGMPPGASIAPGDISQAWIWVGGDSPDPTSGVGTWLNQNRQLLIGGGLALAAVAFAGPEALGAVGVGAFFGFVGGVAGAIAQHKSAYDVVQAGVAGAGVGGATVLIGAQQMWVSGVLGGAAAGLGDIVSQSLSPEPFNIAETIAVTGVGVLSGLVAASPGFGSVVDQQLATAPIAMALGLGASLIPSP